jgi:hypothetical protein
MAPRSLEALLAQAPRDRTSRKRRKLGWTTTRAEGANRTEEHAFPVVAIGHGVPGRANRCHRDRRPVARR